MYLFFAAGVEVQNLLGIADCFDSNQLMNFLVAVVVDDLVDKTDYVIVGFVEVADLVGQITEKIQAQEQKI